MIFGAIRQENGAIIQDSAIPASTTGVLMPYMINDRQYIGIAPVAQGMPANLVGLSVAR